jgi:hypothetical protein
VETCPHCYNKNLFHDGLVISTAPNLGEPKIFIIISYFLYTGLIEKGIAWEFSLWGGQSSWLQIQRSGFGSRRYQIFWEVVGLERGPLNLVSTIVELLGSNGSGSGLENREYGCGDPLRWPRDIFYLQKLALTSPASDSLSVRIVRSRTKATEVFIAW